MKKSTKQRKVNETSRMLATQLVDGIVNKDKKAAEAALIQMVNNRIGAKIKHVAQNENLI